MPTEIGINNPIVPAAETSRLPTRTAIPICAGLYPDACQATRSGWWVSVEATDTTSPTNGKAKVAMASALTATKQTDQSVTMMALGAPSIPRLKYRSERCRVGRASQPNGSSSRRCTTSRTTMPRTIPGIA